MRLRGAQGASDEFAMKLTKLISSQNWVNLIGSNDIEEICGDGARLTSTCWSFELFE